MKKRVFLTILGIIIIYADVAFAIKSGIGVMPVDAAINTVSSILSIKVGTVSILIHGSFFLGQIAIEGKQFQKKELLQILYITLGGTVLNFFLYTVLKDVTFTFYPIRLLVTVTAFFLSALGVMLVMESHLMRTPMDGLIQLIADRIHTPMGKLRQKIDIGLVILTVALTLIFGTEWTLREGTVIAALMFGPALDFWKNKVFRK